MEKYEKSIGLKTIWLTLLRRFHIILLIFIPITLISVVYSYAFIKTEYTNSITLTSASGFTVTKYPTVYSYIKSNTAAASAAEALASTGTEEEPHTPVTHKDGSPITAEEIYKGITMASSISSNTGSISVSFKTSDNTISKATLEALIDVALPNVKKTVTDAQKSSSGATSPTDNSKDKMKYMLIGTAAGLVLGLGFAFVYEIVSDEVRDKGDIEALGCSGFELTVSK